MNQNEPPKQASTPTADEIARQRRARLEAAITPQGVGCNGRRERYTPPPDYPLQPCDFKSQTQFDSLPIEQACFVLLGFQPPPLDVLRFVQDTYNPSREPTWEVPPGYEDVLRSLRLSIGHGNVAAQRIREGRYETKHVSWLELVQWARSKSYAIPPVLESSVAKTAPVALAVPESQAAPVLTPGASVAPSKQRTQEKRILELLKAQGYDPLKLAPRMPGKPGPKAEIKTLALTERALFTAKTFDTAWQRLRDAGEVAGAK